jgi:cell division septation protein DedD
METRLKERLTGAAIIVALIVALVPEMFRGQAGPTVANSASSSSSGDGPPVRTYTIDLSNNPKSSGPLQSASESPPTPAPAPAAPAAPSPPAAAVPSPIESSPAPAPAAVASGVAPKPAAPQRAVRAPLAAPASSPTPAPVKAPAPASGNWSVQLGLFSKRENAARMVNEAKAKGFNTAIAGPDAKGQFHVHVTGLTDRGAAQAVAQRLKGEGLPAVVLAP